MNRNSLKFYHKASVLRSESTINEPKNFHSSSSRELAPSAKTMADFARRAEVSRQATDRHLEALAAAHVKPRWPNKRRGCVERYDAPSNATGLNPLGESDAQLLANVNRGEFALTGFRNRDVRAHLFAATEELRQQRRHMAAVRRRLRLLRAHGLIAKISKTHRYRVTKKGRNAHRKKFRGSKVSRQD